MDEQGASTELRRRIEDVAKEGRLSCPEARKIADEMGIAPKLIGDACNELKIKISNCALGCF